MSIRHLLLTITVAAAPILVIAGAASASPRDDRTGSSTPLPPVTWRSAQSAEDSTPSKTVTVLCAANEWMIAGGGMTVGATGHVRLTSLGPGDDLQTARGTRGGYTITATETAPGTFEPWYAIAWATCAKTTRG